jgi:hypothetical protein
MNRYRTTGLHRALMPKLLLWCDEAAVARWTQDDNVALPGWPEARERLQQDGRRSKVRHPSADHQDFRIAPLGDLSRIRDLDLATFAGGWRSRIRKP